MRGATPSCLPNMQAAMDINKPGNVSWPQNSAQVRWCYFQSVQVFVQRAGLNRHGAGRWFWVPDSLSESPAGRPLWPVSLSSHEPAVPLPRFLHVVLDSQQCSIPHVYILAKVRIAQIPRVGCHSPPVCVLVQIPLCMCPAVCPTQSWASANSPLPPVCVS